MSLRSRDTKYWTWERWPLRRWQRWDLRTDQQGQTCLQGAGAVPSQLVCTVLYSPSPCVSPPPSSIAMEKPCRCMYLTSVQMHLFEKENETLTYLQETGNLCFYFEHVTNKCRCTHTVQALHNAPWSLQQHSLAVIFSTGRAKCWKGTNKSSLWCPAAYMTASSLQSIKGSITR